MSYLEIIQPEQATGALKNSYDSLVKMMPMPVCRLSYRMFTNPIPRYLSIWISAPCRRSAYPTTPNKQNLPRQYPVCW